MGISKCSCEQCGKAFYIGNNNYNWRDGLDKQDKFEASLAGYVEGTYNSRFCSKVCAKAWASEHPGKSTQTFGTRIILGTLLLPFKLIWMICKFFIKCAVKILKNKWFWTISTCGFSYLTWKILNSIYGSK